MDMAVTVLFLPGPVEVAPGLAAITEIADDRILELASLGLLGWGWASPGEDAPPMPWASDPELATLDAEREVPAHLRSPYVAAVRTSLARCLENAAHLLGGESQWFESRIVTRIPVSNGGQLIICPENESAGGDDCAACDIVRLPTEILPELGRKMGIHGLDSIELLARIAPRPM